jgi:hypothetical protein
MILIYSKQPSPRLQYVLQLVFGDVLKIPFELTHNQPEYLVYTGIKLAYTSFKLDDGIIFQPHTLLYETDVRPQNIEIKYIDGLPTMFGTPHYATIGFDVFAAIFYMVSRYEEYLPYTPDAHGRFASTQSLAHKHNFLEIAVVNHWINLLKTAIEQHYNGFLFAKQTYTFTPTIDIDLAFKYKHKPAIQSYKTLYGKLLTGKWAAYNHQKKVLSNQLPDPYNTYNYLADLHEKYQLKPIYFYLFGHYGGLDTNHNPKHPQIIKLLQYLAQTAQVGLHPSAASGQNAQIFEQEAHLLRSYTQNSQVPSRQHFLLLKMPDTYNNLIANNILNDYSMGFADALGFRAGIASPFRFFDLCANQATRLVLHPSAVMDATLNFYKKIPPAQANAPLKKIIDEVKNVKGNLISIWHNNAVSDHAEWRGWRTVYERFLLDAI